MGDNTLATFDHPYLFANEASEMDFLRVTPAAYRILVPMFNCKDTDALENSVFTYREFANAMSEISFIDMGEDNMLVLMHGQQKGQPFPYNPAGLPVDTVVTRQIQEAWCEYMAATYRFRPWSFTVVWPMNTRWVLTIEY